MHRTAREFSTLQNVSAQGFALAGSGSATVRTAPEFKPRRRYRIKLSGSRTPSKTVTLTAGTDRRLHIAVPLGPANPYQQDTVEAKAAGTAVYTTTVTIRRRAR
jgi:hypothetical protein